MKKQQMKLESLSGSKFEAVKGNEIIHTMQIVEGATQATSFGNGTGTDCIELSSNGADKDVKFDVCSSVM